MSLDDRLFGAGPKRVLSLDGGGVRGLVTLGMLAQVETILKARSADPEKFRLCHYFDLIGGTSTGGLIATLLALGYRVDDVITLYTKTVPKIFGTKRLFPGIQSRFKTTAFKKAVEDTLSDFLRRSGRDPSDLDVLRLSSDLLQTGLALVTKRIDTGAVWVLTNNRKSKYWDPNDELWRQHRASSNDTTFYPNSDYPLATIVRASASAPFYLDGVSLRISPDETGHFLDGGASPFNNPCQELFLMTTLKDHAKRWTKEGVSPFGFQWNTGADEYFMLSLGTGTWRNRMGSSKFAGMTAIAKAVHALKSVIDDASKAATVGMQAISDSPGAHRIDGNLQEMHQLRILPEPLLTFRRVNPLLEIDWLGDLDKAFTLDQRSLDRLREIDRRDPATINMLLRIGIAAGKKLISEADFPKNFDRKAGSTPG